MTSIEEGVAEVLRQVGERAVCPVVVHAPVQSWPWTREAPVVQAEQVVVLLRDRRQ